MEYVAAEASRSTAGQAGDIRNEGLETVCVGSVVSPEAVQGVVMYPYE